MKYLVASDIHGSVDSLKLLIHKFSELKYDKIILLGDYLSYSKDDEKVVDMLNFLGMKLLQFEAIAITAYLTILLASNYGIAFICI